jgi:hypothetical protein
MSWSDCFSASLIVLALVQVLTTLRVWVGVSSRRLGFELAISGFVVVSEIALSRHRADGPFVDQLVAHCAAAALLAVVVVYRAVHFRRHLRQLKADIELIDRAIALQNKPSVENRSST